MLNFVAKVRRRRWRIANPKTKFYSYTMKKLFVSVVALLGVCTLSAQDVKTVYNEGAAAYGAKNYQVAAQKFEQVIEQGMDVEDAASLVATAKNALPKCYFQLGGRAMMAKPADYEAALANFSKGAELAELYGDDTQADKCKSYVAKVYQIQGGTAYNNKDYAAAAAVFEKGYAADPNNTEMALNLAMSYCELGEFEKGMDIYEAIAAKTHPKYQEDAAKAKEMMAFYTNNKVAELQGAGDYDGIIALADTQLAKNPANALFQLVRMQAYLGKKDYAKVIETAPAAAEAQTDEADKSTVYYQLAAAYNAREMRDQAIAAFKKVTAGPAAEAAKAALAELQK